MTDDEQCNEIKNDGEPCDYRAKYDDGKCGIHSDKSGTEQGRPSKFNDERAQLAIEAAREGKSEDGCARAAGVRSPTIQNWMGDNPTFTDENGDERDFFKAFVRARANGESELIDGGLNNPDVDSSFAKFLLASSFKYTKTDRLEADIDQNTTHELDDDDRDLARETILRLQEERLEGDTTNE